MNSGSLSDYAENKVLDHIFGGGDFTRPATLHLALFTTVPNDAGSGGVEVSAAGYARVAVTNNSTNFPAASGGIKSNGTAINFATATTSWGNVKAVGVYDASSGGNLIAWSWLYGDRKAVTVNTGTDTFTSNSHGLTDGTKVAFFNVDGTIPGGITENQNYYVINAAANTFKVSATVGGAAVDITSAGDGSNFVAASFVGDVDNGTQVLYNPSTLKFILD